MSNDLIKQAEMRHQRRPAGHKPAENEEITSIQLKKNSTTKTLPQGHSSSDTKQSLPPIRHHGNQDISMAISNLSTMKVDDRPRTPRRRLVGQTNHDIGGIDDFQPKRACLPFVKCKINGKEIKALLNTASSCSSINRRVHELCSIPKVQTTIVNVSMGDDVYKVHLQIDDIGNHDLVLGMDFLSDNNCILDFKQRIMTSNGSNSTSFLTEDELPLKYRNKPTLTASM